MNTNEIVSKAEATEQTSEDFAQVMRELGELELALVGGGTGAVIWA